MTFINNNAPDKQGLICLIKRVKLQSYLILILKYRSASKLCVNYKYSTAPKARSYWGRYHNATLVVQDGYCKKSLHIALLTTALVRLITKISRNLKQDLRQSSKRIACLKHNYHLISYCRLYRIFRSIFITSYRCLTLTTC